MVAVVDLWRSSLLDRSTKVDLHNDCSPTRERETIPKSRGFAERGALARDEATRRS